MRRTLEIITNSFRMALQELWKNKLRTFLSLFGVTIGIFCIISVLATVQSLEHNIQTEIRSLGTNTIYIDKWEYAAQGPDFPYWKYVKRPVPKFEEVEQIRNRAQTESRVAFKINVMDAVTANDNVLNGVIIYGLTEEFPDIQPVEIDHGRALLSSEYDRGATSVLIGFEVAEKLFGEAERALGRTITVRGKTNRVVGVTKKQGRQELGGWSFDQSVIMPYKFARTIMQEDRSDPLIIVKGKETVNNVELKDDLAGAMRAIRRLSPTQPDNFSLNDINDFSNAVSKAFVSVNIGGWAIGALSFIVGIFGVANIMFVTVKERTAQIGLKKAIGAKKGVILMEFLVESAFLCIIGGFIGLLLVFGLTQVVSILLDFPIFLSPAMIGLALLICIIAGILAGIIPALQAARLDPVVAIRSK